MRKNKGYTLVEALIVIAIMAVVSALAFVTIGIIYQAKYNAAIDTFETQMNSLWIKTKALSQGKEQTDANMTTGSDASDKYPLCMYVVKNTDSTDDVKDDSYELILGYDKGSDFEEKETISALTNIVSIRYTAATSSQRHPNLTTANNGNSTEKILIEFNKSDGSVKYGAGVYEFIYNNRVVGSIYLDSITGNHYIK